MVNGLIPGLNNDGGIKGGGGKFKGSTGGLDDSMWIGDGAFTSCINPSMGFPEMVIKLIIIIFSWNI